MKKSELKQLIKEEIEKVLNEGGPMDALGSAYGAFQTPKPKDKSKKNRFLGIFGPSKDVFQRIIKNINSIDDLIKYTESNGDRVEKAEQNAWGISKDSEKTNEAVWQYIDGDLYFENPNYPSIYNDYIRKSM